jgi:V-type H+-transporting ATPase subunit G
VKEARDEAKKEIAEYKAKKEEEYKKFEAEVRRQGHRTMASANSSDV